MFNKYGQNQFSGLKQTNYNTENNLITDILIIDSRDRDSATYPNSNNYIYFLEKEYRNIVEIELVQAFIPNSGYTITSNNNQIIINGAFTTITNGDYTEDDEPANKTKLSEHLTNSIADIEVTYDYNTKKYKIKNTSAAQITISFQGSEILNDGNSYSPPKYNYNDNSLGPLLGFLPKEYTIASGDCIEADNIADFDACKFVLLQIPEFDRLKSINENIEKSFALIPFSDTLMYFDNTKNYGNIKLFNPPMYRLNKLQIVFRDRLGNLFDFSGREHCLIFAVSYKSNSSF